MTAPTILIAVDLQQAFVTEHSAHIVEPVLALTPLFDRVILTKFYNPYPSPFREILDYRKCAPGSAETELVCDVSGHPSVRLFERPLYTCVDDKLRLHLKDIGAKEIYLCGIATEACVLKTALDLFEAGIRCWLITDLCASDEGPEYHETALTLLAKLIGPHHLIGREDARRRLEGQSAA